MKYYLDYKVTSWKRIEVDEEVLDNVKDWLESNLEGNDDLEMILDNYELSNYLKSSGFIEDTEEYLTVEENSGESTIELINEDHFKLWENRGVKNTINNSTLIGLYKKFNIELKEVLEYLSLFTIINNNENGKQINFEFQFKGDIKNEPKITIQDKLSNLLTIEDTIRKLKNK